MSTIFMKIGKSLRAFRNSKGLGQADIAAIAGTSIPTVSEWEKGKSNPTLERFITIAQELNVSLDTLAFFDKESSDNFSKEELKFLREFRKLPINMKESIKNILKEFNKLEKI